MFNEFLKLQRPIYAHLMVAAGYFLQNKDKRKGDATYLFKSIIHDMTQKYRTPKNISNLTSHACI